ncbi:MAG: hypothetical protein IPI73_04870 [Betaproteobacteria bacterium]|nr:hypothetical protein [Betaproteobacteria bacterium]
MGTAAIASRLVLPLDRYCVSASRHGDVDLQEILPAAFAPGCGRARELEAARGGLLRPFGAGARERAMASFEHRSTLPGFRARARTVRRRQAGS